MKDLTPKEKAKELVWQYYHISEHLIANEYANKDWHIAKQYALIAIKEILNIVPLVNREYYNEVKSEIEKL